MSNTLIVVALLWPLAHAGITAGTCSQKRECGTASVPAYVSSTPMDRLAMGPDPGGHTGDKVTPSTTRTGQPVENGPAPKSDPPPASSGEPAKQTTPSQGTGSPPAGANSGQPGERR
jgi:hypothetical protein